MSAGDPPGGAPQRTESLARELARSLLGEATPPALVIERGPGAGARRELAPPPSVLVIGRGDDAGWAIADGDVSRAHAEIRRGWDGITVCDLGSKRGTAIDGVRVGSAPVELRHGATLTLGRVALRFHDPAERHLRGEPLVPPRPPAPRPPARRPPGLALVICLGAVSVLSFLAALWILLAL